MNLATIISEGYYSLFKVALSFQIIYGLVSLKVGEYAIGHFN